MADHGEEGVEVGVAVSFHGGEAFFLGGVVQVGFAGVAAAGVEGEVRGVDGVVLGRGEGEVGEGGGGCELGEEEEEERERRVLNMVVLVMSVVV